MFGSNVQPRRRPKPLPATWRCSCGLNAAYLVNCPACGSRRDDPSR